MTIITSLIARMMAIDLQLFAEAGSMINATTGYVNAYTGEQEPFDSKNSLSPEIKQFYDTQLLENARIEMVFEQFAERVPLPAGNGKSVEFRKANTFGRAGKLQEGVIPDPQKFGVTSITASVDQYGTFTAVTDLLELQAYDPIIATIVDEMGASAAETQEALIRDALMSNPNVFYCYNVDLATGNVVGEQPTSCEEMEANAAIMAKLTPDVISQIATTLKKNRVPTINGEYIGVIHPSVAYDLRKCPEWIEAHKYSATKAIFNGEIGKIHNVRFVENAFASILGGEDYTNKDGGVTYATQFFGAKPYAIIDPEKGALETIVKDKSQVGGPLEQFSTIGYKFLTNGATVLYVERLITCLSTSTYSSKDEPN